MKKLIAVLMCAMFLLLAACTGGGQESNGPRQNPTKYRGFSSRDSVKTFLEGEWTQVSPGFYYEFEGERKLFFENESSAFTFTDAEDGTLAQGTFLVTKYDGSWDLFGKITFNTDSFSSGNSVKEEMFKPDGGEVFRMFAGQVDDKDVLVLRETEDYSSYIGYTAFGETDRTAERYFVFERPSEEATHDIGWRPVNQGFYAFFWKSDTGECYHQPVSYEVFSEPYRDTTVDVVRFAPADGDGCYRSVRFNVNIGEDLYEFDIPDAKTGKYTPRFVWVETDSQGYVSVLKKLTPYGIDRYIAVSRAGSEYRDPAIYDVCDWKYLGRWEVDGEEGTSIEIKEASPQVGGYKIELSFYRRGEGVGYANIEGDSLSINQGEVNGKSILGTITRKGDSLIFKVTYSDDVNIKAGDEFIYNRVPAG